MSTHQLDVPTLHRYLNHRRRLNGLSWRDVARETGLASSTLSRIAHGGGVDANTLLTLLHWLRRDSGLGVFMVSVTPKAEAKEQQP